MRERRVAGRSLTNIKKNKACQDCENNYPSYVMEFHHRNPNEKAQDVSRMVSNGSSIEKIKEEIEKCDLLCANCHRIREFEGAGC